MESSTCLGVYPFDSALLKGLCQIHLFSNVLDLTDLKKIFSMPYVSDLDTGIECICSRLPCVIKSKELIFFFPFLPNGCTTLNRILN